VEYTEKALNVLETARRLFSQKGFKSVTTREIAAQSGVNEVTIFRQFQNKKNLFEAMLDHYIRKPVISDFTINSTPTLQEYLKAVGRYIHSVFVNNIDNLNIELLESKAMQQRYRVSSLPNEIRMSMVRYLTAVTKMSPSEADVYSVSYMSSVQGLCMSSLYLNTWNPEIDFQECIDLLIERFTK
jgi:AcrR family transcriptional regulator